MDYRFVACAAIFLAGLAGTPTVRPTDASSTLPPMPEPAPSDAVLCGSEGNRVQVLYVALAGAPDRYDMMLPTVLQAAWAADAIFDLSAHKTGGHRHIRYMVDDDCEIAVERVRVYNRQFGYMVMELRILGYVDGKYLIFFDGIVPESTCGISTILPDDQPGPGNANNGVGYSRVGWGCWNGHTVAHELVHNFGGVQPSAPNSDGVWHCIDFYDRMCNTGPYNELPCADPMHSSLLDCNEDDYFHTAPPPGSYLATHWNTADSAFLMRHEVWQVWLPMVVSS